MENEERNKSLIEKYEGEKRVLFLLDFPPIAPLLKAMDVYIGDFSSIGYDVLCWNKPMFFLNQQKRDPQIDQGLYLYQCGIQIFPEQYKDLYKIIQSSLGDDANSFGQIRKEIDAYTFGSPKDEKTIKQEIEKSYACFPDKDLNFF